jgi:hypothetical protein
MTTSKPYKAAAAVLVLVLLQASLVSAQHGSSYLGCFSFSRMLYLKGVEVVKVSVHVLSEQACKLMSQFQSSGQAAAETLAAPAWHHSDGLN